MSLREPDAKSNASKELSEAVDNWNRPRPGRVRPVQESAVLASCLVAVAAVVTWAHWPALSARAVCFDDNQYLLDNHPVKTPSLTSVQRFFSEVRSPSTVAGYYQPLTMTSLMLDVAMGGGPDNLRPFHGTSLGLHVLNTLLVTGLLYLLFRRPIVAAMVGLLFGLHPLTVEPIPWVSERKTVLASFFALLSLITYVQYTRSANAKRKAFYGFSLACYVLALLSKPTSTPLPVLMLLLDWWPLGRTRRGLPCCTGSLAERPQITGPLLEKLPFFLVGAVSAVNTVISQQHTAWAAMPGSGSLPRSVVIICHNIIFYLNKIIGPTDLSPFYPFPQPLTLLQPAILAGVIGTCLLISLLVVSLRWTRALLTGWLIFFVAIFPTMGVIGFTIVIASDKYAYLPSVGLLITMAWALEQLWRRRLVTASHGPLLRVVTCLGVLIIAGFEFRSTRWQYAIWENTEQLHRHMLRFAPNEAAVHANLGVELVEQNRIQEGIAHYRRALELDPALPEANVALASALTQEGGHVDEVMSLYTRVLSEWPNKADAHNNLGLVLLNQGQIDKALVHCRRAVELNPEYADGHNNLGLVLATMGQLDEAILHYRRALELKPDHMKAENNLAVALIQQGRIDEAVAAFRRALKLKPDSAEAHNNLGLALKEQGQTAEALALFKEAMRLKADYADAHVNMAIVLIGEGKLEAAIEEYRTALRIQPLDADSHCSLGELMERRGRPGDAMAEYREALRINPQHQQAARRLAAFAATSPAAVVPAGR
jgi:protein O-mannosyl-transferase